MADGEASLNALEPQAEFARVVRSIRMEELSPFMDSDEKTLYTLGFNDGRANYGFGLHESGQITLIAPKEVEGETRLYKTSVAVVNNAELTQFLHRLLRPALSDNLTEAERSVIDEFLHWAQALRAVDILNLQFRDGSSSRFLVDAELTALSAQLVPAPQRPHRSRALHAARLRRLRILHAHGEYAGRYTIQFFLRLRLRAAPASHL